jgi:hypothetical protein
VYLSNLQKQVRNHPQKSTPLGVDTDKPRTQIVGRPPLEQTLTRINGITFNEQDNRIRRLAETIRQLRTLVETLVREPSGKDEIISAMHTKQNTEQKKTIH